MNRRSFLKSASAGAAVLAAAPSTIILAGCSFNVTGAVNTLLSSLEAVLKVAEPGAAWLAPLESAITALQTAEATWTSTGTVSIIEDALNTVEGVLAAIPLTATYSALIDVAVAGVEAILNYFSTSSASGAVTAAVAKFTPHAVNPRSGRVALTSPHFLQTREGAYRAQWNGVAKGLGLTKALI